MWRRELLRNKLYAMILIVLGVLSVLPERDGTFFVWALMIALPCYSQSRIGFGKGAVLMKARVPLPSVARKAMNMEIQRQLAEYDKKHILEIDSMILWLLHELYGFGPKRLRQFYDALAPATEDLVKR